MSTQNNWISVAIWPSEEQLKKDFGRFIVAVDGAVTEGRFGSSGRWTYVCTEAAIKPTHWQPLPAPPPKPDAFLEWYRVASIAQARPNPLDWYRPAMTFIDFITAHPWWTTLWLFKEVHPICGGCHRAIEFYSDGEKATVDFAKRMFRRRRREFLSLCAK